MLEEVSRDTSPSQEIGHHKKSTNGKMTVLFRNVSLRIKGGDLLADVSLGGHPHLYCTHGKSVYELCPSGNRVCTQRWKPPGNLRA